MTSLIITLDTMVITMEADMEIIMEDIVHTIHPITTDPHTMEDIAHITAPDTTQAIIIALTTHMPLIMALIMVSFT